MANKGFSSFTTNFSRGTVGNDNSPTIWTYFSTDTVTASSPSNITSDGYFNAVSNKLKVGDLIFCTGQVSPSFGGLIQVRANSRSVVPTFVAGVVKTSLAVKINLAKSSSGT